MNHLTASWSRLAAVTWKVTADASGSVIYYGYDGDKPLGLLFAFDRTGERAQWGGLAAVRFDVFDADGRLIATKVTGVNAAKAYLIGAS